MGVLWLTGRWNDEELTKELTVELCYEGWIGICHNKGGYFGSENDHRNKKKYIREWYGNIS